ncbi:Sel1 repeat protein [compost metagenome]
MCLQGQGVPKSPDNALALFRKTASQGLANAQSNLGVMYVSGHGVSQDYKKSIYWINKAAEQGFTIAMSNLADGLDVEPNETKADQWRAKSKGFAAVSAG